MLKTTVEYEVLVLMEGNKVHGEGHHQQRCGGRQSGVRALKAEARPLCGYG